MSEVKFLNPSYVIDVYHTCEDRGDGDDFLKENAPFLGEVKNRDNVDQFLGTGYYFWDDHIDMARAWGEYHIKSESYAIIKNKVYIGIDQCFDLVGCRKHLETLIFAINYLNTRLGKKMSWTIGECIEMMRRINKFPYDTIRAVDNVPLPEVDPIKTKFVDKSSRYATLNPKITVCILNKSLLLQPNSIVA